MHLLGTFLRTKPVRWVVLLYAALTILFTQVPLLNYLGYEFSAVLGITAGLLAGLLAISFHQQGYQTGSGFSPRRFVSLALQAFLVNGLLLLIPLGLITVNALFVKNCSFLDGIAFFCLIPVVTIFFAVSLGFGTAVFFRRPILWYIILFLLILLHPIYLTLTSPQLYAYNFFFGYFPGFTYDEVLKITTPLLLQRGITLIAGITILSLVAIVAGNSSRSDPFFTRLKAFRHFFEWKPGSFIAAAGGVLLLGAVAFAGKLGWESSAAFTQRELGSKVSTPHFHIYYSSKHVSDERIKWIAAEHEFRYMQVTRFLHTEIHGKIDSYLYPTPEIKRRLIGTSTTNIAKPWRREIHLNFDSFESAFRHELVHVLAAEFGMPFLQISTSPGLIEGLAVAIDWDAGDRTPHQFAAALFRFGKVHDVQGIFSFTGFAGKPSSVSYLLSGSFCRYLIEEYGMRRFAALYPWARFQKVYRAPLTNLIEEWKAFLRSVEVPRSDEVRTHLLFARPPIFSKVCARTIAELNESATKLFEEKKFTEAIRGFQTSLSLASSREARLGFTASLFQLGNYDSVITTIQKALQDTVLAPTFLPLKITLGDSYWISGFPEVAAAQYEELRSMDINEVYNEATAARLEALRFPRLDSFIRRYLVSARDDTSRISILRETIAKNPDIPIVRYLLGRLSFRTRKYAEAYDHLSKIKMRFQDRTLDYQLQKTMGLALLRLKDFQAAKIHLWHSLNYTRNEGDFNLIQDLVDFCDWLDDHRDQLE